MTTAPARIARPGPHPADSRAALLVTRLTSRLTDRLLGTALAVAACDPSAVLHAPLLVRVLSWGRRRSHGGSPRWSTLAPS
ncbi:hypothetical protein ACH4HG_29510 [Streptomyces coeruleorubidus]|uniref:hypothetical protein n=1 Tax=Streptomyces coeruleorubidus TaxID=116188 RepID=UPI0037A63925